MMNVKVMMNKLLNWMLGFVRRPPRGDEAKTTLEMLAMTYEQELTCDEVHALIDQFAEIQFRGGNAAHLMPLIQRHLEMCPDCREEYEALLTALQAGQP